jgi:Leucine-rich repeat (LRR) protein
MEMREFINKTLDLIDKHEIENLIHEQAVKSVKYLQLKENEISSVKNAINEFEMKRKKVEENNKKLIENLDKLNI